MAHGREGKAPDAKDGTGSGWTAAAAVVVMLSALALAWYGWFPPAPEFFVVRLGISTRAVDRDPIAPPDRPLVLEIDTPVSHLDAVSWEVSLVEASTGTVVFTGQATRSAREDTLRVAVTRGLRRSGRYEVSLVAQGGAGTRPPDQRFHFFIAQAP